MKYCLKTLSLFNKEHCQYPTGIPVAIPVTVRIRGFAGISVPAKFHFFAGIPYRDFTLNLVIKTCQIIKVFQQKFDKKHV